MNHNKQYHWQCEGPNFGRKSLQRRRPVRFSSFRDPSPHRLIISGGCERLLRDSKPRGRCSEDSATSGFCEADSLLEQSWHWRDHCQGWFHLLDHSLFFFIFFPRQSSFYHLYQIEFLSFSSPRCWPPSDRPFRPQSASLSRGDEILQSPQCFQEIYLKFNIGISSQTLAKANRTWCWTINDFWVLWSKPGFSS